MDSEKKVKVLVVDDERRVREFLTQLLAIENTEVKCAEDGLKAIEAVKKENFDLAFLDVRMPGMDGLQTFRELKKLSPDIKCVMITGYAVDDLLEQARIEGAVASIQKPLDISQIDSLIKEYAKPPCSQKINILVVDDEKVVLNFFKRIFKDNLYDVTTLETGQETLDLVMKKEFDIAFIDIALPDISGVDLYLKLRKINPNIHLMLITGDPSRAEGIEHLGYLCKPFEMDKIFLEIDKIKYSKKVL